MLFSYTLTSLHFVEQETLQTLSLYVIKRQQTHLKFNINSIYLSELQYYQLMQTYQGLCGSRIHHNTFLYFTLWLYISYQKSVLTDNYYLHIQEKIIFIIIGTLIRIN